MEYRINVGLRAAAAVLGGYALAALTAQFLARGWPTDRLQATIWATIAAMLVMPGVAIWAFLARTPGRALAGMTLLGLALMAGAASLGPHP